MRITESKSPPHTDHSDPLVDKGQGSERSNKRRAPDSLFSENVVLSLAKRPRVSTDDFRSDGESHSEDSKTASRPRVRPPHPQSDGESESGDPAVLYRALRPEEDPWKNGLQPPEGNDPTISARAHVQAGSKAERKSDWVSATRSLKTAAVWAASSGTGRVAKLRATETRIDLTDAAQAKEVFPKGGMGLNAAKGSQEVLIKGGVPAENILDVFNAQKLLVTDYKERKARAADASGGEAVILLRSRTKTAGDPIPVALTSIPRPDDGSHS